jgi:3-keto-disaccharide hydrolase
MFWKIAGTWLTALITLTGIGRAADKPAAFTDPAQAGPEYALQGEYAGDLQADGAKQPLGAQVIALGLGKFHAVLYYGGLPGAGWERSQKKEEFDGQTKDDALTFQLSGGRTAAIDDGKFTLTGSGGESLAELKKVERQSPTLGAKAPADATVLFDGTNLDQFKGGQLSSEKCMVVGAAGGPRGDAVTQQSWGDFQLHLEFRTPFMPEARGQGRGNSGVYLQNRYECQVLDSFGLSGENNECGGFYKLQQPRVNMCLPPLAWQTYDVDFKAPRFEEGKKTANARVTVRHNGVVIHDDLDVPHVTPGGLSTEGPTGPLKLQDHGNPVAYRNIWILSAK